MSVLLPLAWDPLAVAQFDCVLDDVGREGTHCDLGDQLERAVELFGYSPRVRAQGASAILKTG